MRPPRGYLIVGTPAAGTGRGGGEHGSISILAAATMVMVLFLAAATGDVVKWLQASARAQVAADAAALAAVQEMAEPTGQDPRAVASSFAVRNGASLLSCDCPVEGTSATVEVRTPVGGVLFLRSGTASARARAVADLGAG